MNAILSLLLFVGRSIARFYRYAVLDSVRIVKASGLRGLVRERGWRFAGAVIAYYLVRDTLLYVVLPLAVARGVL